MIGNLLEKFVIGIMLMIMLFGSFAQVITEGWLHIIIYLIIILFISCLNPIINYLQKRGILQ